MYDKPRKRKKNDPSAEIPKLPPGPRPDRVKEPRAAYGSPYVRPVLPYTPPGAAGGRGERMAWRCEHARRVFDSDAELARVLGVDRSRVSRWRQGEPPDAANADRIVAIDAVVELLSGFLEERTIGKWLYGVNAHLRHRRPVDVLAAGRFSEVMAAIEAEKSGAYA